MSTVIGLACADNVAQNLHMKRAPADPETQGGRIRLARESIGMTQGKLATALKTSRSSVTNYELQRAGIRDDIIDSVAAVTGANASWLRAGIGTMRERLDGDDPVLLAKVDAKTLALIDPKTKSLVWSLLHSVAGGEPDLAARGARKLADWLDELDLEKRGHVRADDNIDPLRKIR